MLLQTTPIGPFGMPWETFVDLASELAWPLVVLFIALYYKKQIQQFMDRVVKYARKLSGPGGFAVEFPPREMNEKQIQKVVEAVIQNLEQDDSIAPQLSPEMKKAISYSVAGTVSQVAQSPTVVIRGYQGGAASWPQHEPIQVEIPDETVRLDSEWKTPREEE